MSTSEGRAQERRRRALLTSLAATVARATSYATAFVSVPLTLRYLGEERYGVWVTMSSLLAMLSFTDLGIGNALLNAVAQAHGRDDRSAVRRLVSSAYTLLSGVGLVVGVIAIVAFSVIPWPQLLNVHSEIAVTEVGPATEILLFYLAANIPLAVIQKVQAGLQQGFYSALWQCGASLLSLVSLLVAIHLHAGLPELTSAILGVPLLICVANTVVFFYSQRDLCPSIRCISPTDMKRIAQGGGAFFVMQAVTAFGYCSDNLIVAQILGAGRVIEISLPAQLYFLITAVMTISLSPLWPAYGEAISRRDFDWTLATFLRSLMFAVTFASIIAGLMLIFGPALLFLWVGVDINPPFALTVGLAFWKVLESVGNAISMFLSGANVIREQAMIAIVTGVAVFCSKVFAVWQLDVVGIPWAMLSCYILFTIVPYLAILRQLEQRWKNSDHMA
jgi:O-antigen/teichoic acid export membrane protein